jgi:outer membrane immunogenic protein
MKHVKLGFRKFVISALLIAGPLSIANAADMAVKAPPLAVAPVAYNWTSCYVGGYAGGLWAHKDWTNVTPGAAVVGPLGGHDVDGGIYGGQLGCDVQTYGNWVFGIQGSLAGLHSTGSNVNQLVPAILDQTQIRSLTTITGKVAYAMGNFLPYVKGGGAWVRDSYTLTTIATGLPFSVASETRGGYTLGIGGEYALTKCVTGFAEYNHYEFGTRTLTFPAAVTDYYGIRERADEVVAGLNVRIGQGWCSSPAPAPLVTKN